VGDEVVALAHGFLQRQDFPRLQYHSERDFSLRIVLRPRSEQGESSP
jgi:hypothetical protein